MVHDVITTTTGALIMSRVSVAVLCGVISRKCKLFIDTLFHDFLAFLQAKGRKKKIVKDEKKHQGAVDESSVEQQFRESDTISFV